MKMRILLPVLGGILVWTAFIRAQEPVENNAAPTVVFGAAATPDGGQNTFVVEQPKDAPNPLGNPIAVDNTPPQVFDIVISTEIYLNISYLQKYILNEKGDTEYGWNYF